MNKQSFMVICCRETADSIAQTMESALYRPDNIHSDEIAFLEALLETLSSDSEMSTELLINNRILEVLTKFRNSQSLGGQHA
jgi:hypothetical protein